MITSIEWRDQFCQLLHLNGDSKPVGIGSKRSQLNSHILPVKMFSSEPRTAYNSARPSSMMSLTMPISKMPKN